MLEEFLSVAGSVDFEEYGELLLTKAESSGASLTLWLSVSYDERPDFHRDWKIICSGVADEELSFGDHYLLQLADEHVLLWKHNKPQTSVSFYGSAADPSYVVGALYEKHRALVGDWIPFHEFLNMSLGLTNLIAGGFGRLAEGPEPLVLAYEEVMQQCGFSTSHLAPSPSMHWDGARWAEDSTAFSVLTLDESYVIASGFEAVKV